MATSSTAPDGSDQRPLLRRMPSYLWWAAAAAALGFVVRITLSSSTTENGVVTSCSYVDLGRVVLAGIAVCLVVGAFLANNANRRFHPHRYVPAPVLAVPALLILAVAAYHVVAGLGLVGSPCA